MEAHGQGTAARLVAVLEKVARGEALVVIEHRRLVVSFGIRQAIADELEPGENQQC